MKTGTKIITKNIQSSLITNVLTSYTNVTYKCKLAMTECNLLVAWSRKTRRCTALSGGGAGGCLVFIVLLLRILHACLVFIDLMMYSWPGKYIHKQNP